MNNLLMNTILTKNSSFKRVKERTVQEAQEKVLEWRAMFENGYLCEG